MRDVRPRICLMIPTVPAKGPSLIFTFWPSVQCGIGSWSALDGRHTAVIESHISLLVCLLRMRPTPAARDLGIGFPDRRARRDRTPTELASRADQRTC